MTTNEACSHNIMVDGDDFADHAPQAIYQSSTGLWVGSCKRCSQEISWPASAGERSCCGLLPNPEAEPLEWDEVPTRPNVEPPTLEEMRRYHGGADDPDGGYIRLLVIA